MIFFPKGVRTLRALFLFLVLVMLQFFAAQAVSRPTRKPASTESVAVRVEKARELVLKGDRSGAVKIFKEIYVSLPSSPGGKPNSAQIKLMQPWREIAEIVLTDKSQNQISLAESIWMIRPKDAIDILTPLLKAEDGNLEIARLGARSAIRAQDCSRADFFTSQAEAIFPHGADVKLLKLQVQECINGTNPSAPAIKIVVAPGASVEAVWGELAPAIHRIIIGDALRRKDLRNARLAILSWQGNEDPEFWYWKWKVSDEAQRDRLSARKYLRLCSEMNARRRKNFAMHPELCLWTETVESELKSSDKSGS